MDIDADKPTRDPRRRAALRLARRHYLGEMRARPWLAAGAFLLPGLGNTSILYLPPLLVAHIVGLSMQGNTPSGVAMLPWLVLFGGSIAFGEACWRVGVHCLARLDARGMESLYNRGFSLLLERDLAFFHDNFAGSLTKRLIGYARRFEEFADTLVFNIASNLVPLVFAAVVLWRYDPRLVLVLFGGLAVTAALVYPLILRRQRLVDSREAASSDVAAHIADSLTNVDAVRVFAAEADEQAIHARHTAIWSRRAIASWDYQNRRIDLVAAPMTALTNTAGLALAVGVAGSGRGPEAVIVTFAFFMTATRILWEFNSIYRSLESSITEAAQFTDVLLDEPTVVDDAEPLPTVAGPGAVRFDRVRFAYSARADRPLFDRFSLDIAAGERVGLVGGSGGGKSTLTRLLLRLMDIDEGEISIDGRSIAAMSQAELRGLIAYVPQDPSMFHRSLADNIAYGRPGASRAEVEAAARIAHASAFIDDLPLGYDTLVGERGVKLSGGQRQRVALARAVIRHAPVLVLDEATSALDSESEHHIQDALDGVMANRTVLVIAHRLSTVQRLDRLVVLEAGRIVEQGSHADLVARGGRYARLWDRQSGGFLAHSSSSVGSAGFADPGHDRGAA